MIYVRIGEPLIIFIDKITYLEHDENSKNNITYRLYRWFSRQIIEFSNSSVTGFTSK
jgi:hypothetical protein